jgi:hypothetical protein
MLVYAGIDEAGYGPFFGPMTVGRCVLTIPKLDASAPLPNLWARLRKAVCKNLTGRAGRIVVNDSKKLKTKAAGIKHLELGCLAFAGLCDRFDRLTGSVDPATQEHSGGGGGGGADVAWWLDALGETTHRELHGLPWYSVAEVGPWAALPGEADPGELAVARGMLGQTCRRIGVEVADLGAAVVFEDRFNRMVAATRSKAAVSFTFVAGHLQTIWQDHGEHHPVVVVDRQSGRMRYRELLAMNFPGCAVDVLRETAAHSVYRVWGLGSGVWGLGHEPAAAASESSQGYKDRSRPQTLDPKPHTMTVHFQTEAEQQHLPVALASMLAKYNRELLMHRFQAYWHQKLPGVKPTAGYGSDAKRFGQEVGPHLQRLGIDPRTLRRQA